MTREEMLAILNNISKEQLSYQESDALEMAIKSLQSEPCEDCISRQAVLNLINEDWKYEGLEKLVKWLPPVTPTRKKGKWIELRDSYDEPYEVCSICNCNGTHIFDYCPFCGSEMEKVRISNE